jgi:hypothetical protein
LFVLFASLIIVITLTAARAEEIAGYAQSPMIIGWIGCPPTLAGLAMSRLLSSETNEKFRRLPKIQTELTFDAKSERDRLVRDDRLAQSS